MALHAGWRLVRRVEAAMIPLPDRWWAPTFYAANPVALDFYQCRARYVACHAGRRAMKTEFSKRRLIECLDEKKPWPDPRYFASAPTHDQAKRIFWRDLKALVPRQWIRDWDRDVSDGDLCIRTGFGSELWVFGMDRPQRAEGLGWDGGVVTECCDLDFNAARAAVMPMLSDRLGWSIWEGAPKLDGIGVADFRAFCEHAASGADPDEACFTWPSEEVLTGEQLAYDRQHMDPMLYAAQHGGLWQNVGGGICHTFSPDYNVRACAFNPERPLIIGSDFNVNPMAWALGHTDGRIMEWFDELFLRDTNTSKTLDVLWQKYGRQMKATVRFYGDATARQRKTSAALSDYQQILNHKHFRALGHEVHYPKGNPRVVDRFAALNAMWLNQAGNRRQFVDPRCENIIASVKHAAWKIDKATGGSIREPAPSIYLHMLDAISYATFLLFPVALQDGAETPRVGIDRLAAG